MFNTKESFIENLRAFDTQQNNVAKAAFEQNLTNYATRTQHLNPGTEIEPQPEPPKKVRRDPVFEPEWGFTLRVLDEPVSAMKLADVMPRFTADDPDRPTGPIGRLGRIVNGVQTYMCSSKDTTFVGAMYTSPEGEMFVKSGDTNYSHFWIKLK